MRMAIVSFIIKEQKFYQYQRFLLQEVEKVADRVIVVCNQAINQSTKEWCISQGLEWQLSDQVFDVAMWKDIILSNQFQIEKKSISELILLNDSFFGPLYPWAEVFEEMEGYSVDFWGISAHCSMKLHGMKWPRFLQRFFLVFRSQIIQSESWSQFWEKLTKFECYEDTEEKFEFILTKYFEDRGYQWKAFCDTEEWETKEIERAMPFIIFRAYEMLEKKRLPVVSKQIFLNSKEIDLCYHYGNESNKVLEFLSQNTEYDVIFIYEFLIKNVNPYQLWSCLNCTHIVSENRENMISMLKKKAVVIAHLYYDDWFENALTFLEHIPTWMDLIITTDSDYKIRKLRELCEGKLYGRCLMIEVINKGREWSALLLEVKKYLKDYEYFCFIHDKKSSQMFYPTVGASFNEYIWNIMLPGREQIENIISIFENNDLLGMMAPPVVYHGEFWGHSSDFWTINFEGTKELAQQLELKIIPSEEYPLLTVGSCFWGRTAAFQRLFSYPFKYDDFQNEPLDIDGTLNHFLERILTFVVQSAGYYSAVFMSERYAEYDITNLRVMLSKILQTCKKDERIDIVSPVSTIQTLGDTGKKQKGKKLFWRKEIVEE